MTYAPITPGNYEVVFMQSSANPAELNLAKRIIRSDEHWLLIGFDALDRDRTGWWILGKIGDVPVPDVPLPIAEIQLHDFDLPRFLSTSLIPPYKWDFLKVARIELKK